MDLEKYMEMLRARGADPAIEIDPRTVETAAWTVFTCKYGCARYGKTHCCPPEAPTWKQTQEILDCYHRAVLFCVHHWETSAMVAEVVREAFLDGYYKAIGFGSGPCEICKKCNPEGCNFPDKVIPAMESCGIDVFATARNNGLEIHTLRDPEEQRNCFGLILFE